MKCTLNERDNNRIIEVEHTTLTPLATGGMSRECRKFYSRLSQMLSDTLREEIFAGRYFRRRNFRG